MLLQSCNDHFDEINKAHEDLERQHAEIFSRAEKLAQMSHEDNENDSVPSSEVYELASEIMSIIEYDSIERVLDDVVYDLAR